MESETSYMYMSGVREKFQPTALDSTLETLPKIWTAIIS